MIKTILTMYIIHIAGMVLCVGKEFYVIQILELFYVEIIIFPVIFDGQTPLGCLGFLLIIVIFSPISFPLVPLTLCIANVSSLI